MGQPVNEKSLQKPRILVVPLDWGLGHATRCIPIINELLANGCDVWLAGEGLQEALLGAEFPGIPFLSLPGYRVQYSRTKKALLWKMLIQLPRILAAIKKENNWLKKMVAEHRFDAVISDSRFGIHHQNIPCVFITHQLNIKSPIGKWAEKFLQRWNYHYINRFSECWVPDHEDENNLAGELSHPAVKPKTPLKYLGPVSRLERHPFPEIKNYLLIILSGPEPQRSILENKIIDEIVHYPATTAIVRGLPSSHLIIPSTGTIKFYNHLPTKEMNEEMEKAEWVIGRCGYSTVMDLVKLQKKSILIPTPGQTEQEYLAKHLFQKQVAFCIDQDKFSVSSVLKLAKKFNYRVSFPGSSQKMKTVVQSFLKRLQ